MVRKDSSDKAVESAQEAAAEIFVLCLPLLLTDAVRRAHPMASSQFHLVAADGASLAPGLIEDDPRVVVSSAWIDLSGEPVVLRLPNTRGRHFSLTVMDTAGDPFASLGTRTGDDGGVDLALAGPRWRGEVHRGMRAKRSTSDACWVVSRIHAHSMLDRPETVSIARRQGFARMGCEPDRESTIESVLESLPSSYLWHVTEIAPDLFFHRLDAVLDRAPHAFHRANGVRLASLRAALGGPSAAGGWDARFRDDLARGMVEGLAAVRAAADALPVNQGVGWRTLAGVDETVCEGALHHAARAYLNLGAPAREDLLTLVCDRDEAGKALWGPNAYRLSFAQAGLPPVQGYWRLYARPAASSIRRGLGSRNDLLLNPDGSLDLFIQQTPPNPADVGNWLQTPGAELALVMRLYAPQPAALSGAWRMPAVHRVAPDAGADRRGRNGGSPALRIVPSTHLQAPMAWRNWL